jgi:hypothetical protein
LISTSCGPKMQTQSASSPVGKRHIKGSSKSQRLGQQSTSTAWLRKIGRWMENQID